MRAYAFKRQDTAFSSSRRAKETERVDNPNHRAWICTLPSVISGEYGCECAHINYRDKRFGKPERGKGTRASDRFVLPLTPDEHRTGPQAQHKTGHERQWWEAQGIDATTLADDLWRVSGDTEAAIEIINHARNRT